MSNHQKKLNKNMNLLNKKLPDIMLKIHLFFQQLSIRSIKIACMIVILNLMKMMKYLKIQINKLKDSICRIIRDNKEDFP